MCLLDIIQQYSVIDLKTKYNATFLKNEFDEWEQRIEDMYYLHYPRMFIDPYTMQLGYESNHIEDLALSIIEEREKLEKFKRKANHDLKNFQNILSNYTDIEQRHIKRYQRDDVITDENLILRICEDISNIDSKYKEDKRLAIQEEIKADKEQRKAEGKARKEKIKQRLKQERQKRLLQAN